MPESIKVVRTLTLVSDDAKWVVPSVETIDGVEFLPISHRDKCCVKFFCGTSRDSTFLRQLKDWITEATAKAALSEQVTDSLFEDPVPEGRRASKKRRVASRSAADRGDVPPHVVVHAPGFEFDGQAFSPCNIVCKPAYDKSAVIHVHADPVPIAYIRAAVKHHAHGIKESVGNKVATEHGITWRADRGCFVAKHGEKYRQFKPDGDDEQSMQFAAATAKDWAATRSDESP